MTPKEKAIQLRDTYKKFTYGEMVGRNSFHYDLEIHLENARWCAIICVDEMLKIAECEECGKGPVWYLEQVKEEIEKL